MPCCATAIQKQGEVAQAGFSHPQPLSARSALNFTSHYPGHMLSHFHPYLLAGYLLVFFFNTKKFWRRKCKQFIIPSPRTNMAIWSCSLGLTGIAASFLHSDHCLMCPTLCRDIESACYLCSLSSFWPWGFDWIAFPAILAISYLLLL